MQGNVAILLPFFFSEILIKGMEKFIRLIEI